MITSYYNKPTKSKLDSFFDWIEKNANTYAQISGLSILTVGLLFAWSMIEWTPRKYSINQVHLTHDFRELPKEYKLLELTYTKSNNKLVDTEYGVYIIKTGDTLWSISQDVGVSLNDLREMNYLDGDLIREGQEILYKK